MEIRKEFWEQVALCWTQTLSEGQLRKIERVSEQIVHNSFEDLIRFGTKMQIPTALEAICNGTDEDEDDDWF